MQASSFFRLILAGLAAAVAPAGPARAQDLPSPGLLLPPLPPALELASASVPRHSLSDRPVEKSRRHNAVVSTPRSHLTLPEKPVFDTPTPTPDPVPGPAPAPSDAPGLELLEPTDIPGEIPLSNPLLPLPDPPEASDLLPPLEEFPGAAPSEMPPGDSSRDGPASDSNRDAPSGSDPSGVPGSDLAPAPSSAPEPADPGARGPIFRVRGAEAYALAREKGFRFTPAQGLGRRDGIHTVASQVPNVLTSEVHGTRMMQMRPSPLWTTPWIENTFYMFCDASYNAVRLAPGWKIRGIQLKGPDWQWVACPRSGANTASFSIRIRSWKLPDAPAHGTVVMLHGLTLEGPPGAVNWKAAFPDLNRPAPLAKQR